MRTDHAEKLEGENIMSRERVLISLWVRLELAWHILTKAHPGVVRRACPDRPNSYKKFTLCGYGYEYIPSYGHLPPRFVPRVVRVEWAWIPIPLTSRKTVHVIVNVDGIAHRPPHTACSHGD